MPYRRECEHTGPRRAVEQQGRAHPLDHDATGCDDADGAERGPQPLIQPTAERQPEEWHHHVEREFGGQAPALAEALVHVVGIPLGQHKVRQDFSEAPESAGLRRESGRDGEDRSQRKEIGRQDARDAHDRVASENRGRPVARPGTDPRPQEQKTGDREEDGHPAVASCDQPTGEIRGGGTGPEADVRDEYQQSGGGA
ncbi:hypothetical protein GCM10027599_12890 [Yimella radicis]